MHSMRLSYDELMNINDDSEDDDSPLEMQECELLDFIALEEESSNFESEMEKQLIKHIVEKTKQGGRSPNRLEQFNDVLFQENGMKVNSDTPLFDLSALQLVQKNGSIPLAKAGWYGNVVCVGKESDIPILTMTCTLSVLDKFTSGEVLLRPPAKAYANSLVMGLVEGGRLSEEEAWAYIDNAASKPL
ncbi:hypothetical protein Bca4012_067616 [Brassica carinata]